MKELIQELIKEGKNLAPQGGGHYSGYNGDLQTQYLSWRMRVIAVLERLGPTGNTLLKQIEKDKDSLYFFKSSADLVLGMLEAAEKIIEDHGIQSDSTNSNDIKIIGSEVFIVHGHNNEMLQTIARFISKLQLEPIILFEQAGKSRTIIEKLEAHSNSSYAIVLLTADDEGKSKIEAKYSPRGRQNVILELGYFIGKLGRENVCVLYEDGVELPSDYRGVEYISIDSETAWKLKLGRELKAAGLNIDMNDAL